MYSKCCRLRSSSMVVVLHFFFVVMVLLLRVEPVESHVHIEEYNHQNGWNVWDFKSVAYFDFAETGWGGGDMYLNGLAYYHYFYYHDNDLTTTNPDLKKNAVTFWNHSCISSNTEGDSYISAVVPLFDTERIKKEWGMDDDDINTTTVVDQSGDDAWNDDTTNSSNFFNPFVELPKILVTSLYSSDEHSLPIYQNRIMAAASSIQASFIVVLLGKKDYNDDRKDQWKFWWTHQIPNFTIPSYDDDDSIDVDKKKKERCFILAVTPQIHDMQSFLLRNNTVDGFEFYYLGFDDYTPLKGRTVVLQCLFGYLVIFLCYKWIFSLDGGNQQQRHNYSDGTRRRGGEEDDDTAMPPSFQLLTSEDLGRGEICHVMDKENQATGTESSTPMPPSSLDCCCICLEEMPTGTTVCILPCRHSFHPQCVDHWFQRTAQDTQQYSCPLCKMNLVPHFQERFLARHEILQHSHGSHNYWERIFGRGRRRRRRFFFWESRLRLNDDGTLYHDNHHHEDVLLNDREREASSSSLGDLELTVESPSPPGSFQEESTSSPQPPEQMTEDRNGVIV